MEAQRVESLGLYSSSELPFPPRVVAQHDDARFGDVARGGYARLSASLRFPPNHLPSRMMLPTIAMAIIP